MLVIQCTQIWSHLVILCMYYDTCLFLNLALPIAPPRDIVPTTTPPRAKEVAEEEEVDNQVRRFFPESWLFDVVETK